jgi:hypothetical protein
MNYIGDFFQTLKFVLKTSKQISTKMNKRKLLLQHVKLRNK